MFMFFYYVVNKEYNIKKNAVVFTPTRSSPERSMVVGFNSGDTGKESVRWGGGHEWAATVPVTAMAPSQLGGLAEECPYQALPAAGGFQGGGPNKGKKLTLTGHLRRWPVLHKRFHIRFMKGVKANYTSTKTKLTVSANALHQPYCPYLDSFQSPQMRARVISKMARALVFCLHPYKNRKLKFKLEESSKDNKAPHEVTHESRHRRAVRGRVPTKRPAAPGSVREPPAPLGRPARQRTLLSHSRLCPRASEHSSLPQKARTLLQDPTCRKDEFWRLYRPFSAD